MPNHDCLWSGHANASESSFLQRVHGTVKSALPDSTKRRIKGVTAGWSGLFKVRRPNPSCAIPATLSPTHSYARRTAPPPQIWFLSLSKIEASLSKVCLIMYRYSCLPWARSREAFIIRPNCVYGALPTMYQGRKDQSIPQTNEPSWIVPVPPLLKFPSSFPPNDKLVQRAANFQVTCLGKTSIECESATKEVLQSHLVAKASIVGVTADIFVSIGPSPARRHVRCLGDVAEDVPDMFPCQDSL